MQKRNKALYFGLGAVAVLCVGGWAYRKVWQNRVPYLSAAERLDATMAEARSLGIKLTPDELHPGKGKDPKQNAAEDYRRAALLISASGVRTQGGAGLPIGTFVFSGGDPAYRKNSELAIKLTQLPAEVLQQGFKKEYCDLDLTYKQAPGFDTTQVVDIRPMTYVFGARAVIAAQQHKVDEALENVYFVNRIRDQLSDDPGIARSLLGNFAEAAGPQTLIVILSLLGESQEVVDKTRALLTKMQPDYTLEFALSADLCSGLLDIDQLGEPLPQTASNRRRRLREELEKEYVPASILRDAYKERLIQYWIGVTKKIRQYPDQPYLAAREIDNSITHFGQKAVPADQYARMFVPSAHWAVATSIMRQKGFLAVIAGYLDIMEYKLKNGKLPVTGKELKLPIDPFTQLPLMFKRTSNGYTLACEVGVNPATGGPAAPLGIEYPGPYALTFGGRSSDNSRPRVN